MKQVTTRTIRRASVSFQLRPIKTTRTQPGKGGEGETGMVWFGAGISPIFGTFRPSRNSDLAHRLVQRGVKLIHRGLGFVAHVGDAEGFALDFPVTAVNQKSLVFGEFLQFRHIHNPAAGFRTVVHAGEGDGLKTLLREERKAVFRRPGAGHFGQLFVAGKPVFQAFGEDIFQLRLQGIDMTDARRAGRHALFRVFLEFDKIEIITAVLEGRRPGERRLASR